MYTHKNIAYFIHSCIVLYVFGDDIRTHTLEVLQNQHILTNLLGTPKSVASRLGCSIRCVNTENCKAASFNKTGKTCQLHWSSRSEHFITDASHGNTAFVTSGEYSTVQ